jgi:hypothetical protein
MSEAPFFCDDCGEELTHDEIHTAEAVPQLDIDTYEMFDQVADVFQCAHCGTVIGFDVPES